MSDEVLEVAEESPEESPELRARRDAALANVRQMGDPVLRTRAVPVTVFDDQLRAQIDWMRGIMDGALGIGLAATQVGSLARALVYRVEDESPTTALINPVVEWHGEETATAEEGCLSIPGIRVDVERFVHVRIGGVDEEGEPQTIEASGLEARVLQHEIDHLDGVLMIDRAGRAERREAMRAWRERLQAAE
ncbi:MAG: peptide deformylase [Solirubrobacteraceae bacterium]